MPYHDIHSFALGACVVKIKRFFAVLLKNVLPTVLGIAFLILVMLWLAGVFHPKISPGQSDAHSRTLGPNDTVDEVHEVTKEYFEEAVGTLKASSRTEISARVLAPIEKIPVRAGQAVQAGDVLIQLDPRALETQYSQVQASLVAAQADLKKAENDFKRAQSLLEKRAISVAQFDQDQTKLQVAKANLNHAQQAVAEAEVMLSYTTIKAPKSGVIVDRLAEQGDMARPGVPLLVLYDPTSLRLEVPVMENLAVKLKVGDKLTVRIDALDREVMATVDEIVPQAEAASRSFLVKVALPRSGELFEGMFGRLLIPAGARRHLCLNTQAIQRIGQLELVDVIEPDGTLQRRYIKTGRLGMPGRVEVLSGLKAGEKVRIPSGTKVASPTTDSSTSPSPF